MEWARVRQLETGGEPFHVALVLACLLLTLYTRLEMIYSEFSSNTNYK